MKQTVTESMFISAFADCGREDNFSVDGRIALYEWLEEYGESTGSEVELDVIALCCDFTEWESLEEFQGNYGDEYRSFDDISDATTLIDIDGERFITQDF